MTISVTHTVGAVLPNLAHTKILSYNGARNTQTAERLTVSMILVWVKQPYTNGGMQHKNPGLYPGFIFAYGDGAGAVLVSGWLCHTDPKSAPFARLSNRPFVSAGSIGCFRPLDAATPCAVAGLASVAPG